MVFVERIPLTAVPTVNTKSSLTDWMPSLTVMVMVVVPT